MLITVDTVALLLGLGVFLAILAVWQRNDDEFDLRWLLVDSATGKVSLFKVGQFVALCVSTWLIIYETRQGNLTEWLFGGYMIAWSGANLVNKWIDKKVTP